MQVRKIGHLALFTVVKAWPDASAVLVWLEPDGPFAVLPKAEARQAYRVGDTGFAAIAAMAVPYPRLSQRTVHYVRRMAELILAPVRREGRVAVVRVAADPAWPWAKVLVRAASPEALREAIQLVAGASGGLRLVLVPQEEDFVRQVQAALYPAPPRAILAVRSGETPRTVIVTVAPEARGRVIGPGGWNLRAASRLLRRRLQLAPAVEPSCGNTLHRMSRPTSVSGVPEPVGDGRCGSG
jgi:hypothetical protein